MASDHQQAQGWLKTNTEIEIPSKCQDFHFSVAIHIWHWITVGIFSSSLLWLSMCLHHLCGLDDVTESGQRDPENSPGTCSVNLFFHAWTKWEYIILWKPCSTNWCFSNLIMRNFWWLGICRCSDGQIVIVTKCVLWNWQLNYQWCKSHSSN